MVTGLHHVYKQVIDLNDVFISDTFLDIHETGLVYTLDAIALWLVNVLLRHCFPKPSREGVAVFAEKINYYLRIW